MHFALHLHGVIYKCVCVSLCLSVCVKSVHSVCESRRNTA